MELQRTACIMLGLMKEGRLVDKGELCRHYEQRFPRRCASEDVDAALDEVALLLCRPSFFPNQSVIPYVFGHRA